MKRSEAVEVILAGRRAASRSGQIFTVNRARLGAIGPFNSGELDRIERAADKIEAVVASELQDIDR